MSKRRLTASSSVKNVRDYLESPEFFELDEYMSEKLQMVEDCRDMIADDKTTPEVVAELQTRYGIGKMKALNIIHETDMAYSIRAIKIETLFSEIRKTKVVATEKKDPKAMAQSDRNRLQAIRDFYGTKDQKAYENLQPQEVQIGEFKELTVLKDVSDREIDDFVKQMKKKAIQKATEFSEDTDVLNEEDSL